MKLVLGNGPSALRVAIGLGDSKLLCGEESPLAGVDQRLPEDLGRANARNRGLISEVYGGAPSASLSGRSRALWAEEGVVELPITPLTVRHAAGAGNWRSILAGQLLIRADRVVRAIRGGGLEERTYRDWVVHRFGEGAYRALHAPWATARWGDPATLSQAIADRFHGSADAEFVQVGRSASESWARLAAAGVEFEGGVTPKALEFADGRVRRIIAEGGAIDCEDGIWVCDSPASLLELLPEELAEPLRGDLSRLVTRDRLQVAFEVGGAAVEYPEELYVIGGGTSIFKVTSPGHRDPGARGVLVAHISTSSKRDLPIEEIVAEASGMMSSLGLPIGEHGGVTVTRFRSYDPSWRGVWHTTHTRVLLKLQAMGINLVGRGGAFRYLDPGEELALARRAADGDLHEAIRVEGDPRVVHDPDLDRARLDHFVLR